jgi:8-oxo-dGTP diphosphatase
MRRTAGGALVAGGKVLLGLRRADEPYYPNVWDVCGGHCEPSESLEDALVRELAEELGVRAIRWTKLGAFEEPDPDRHGAAEHHVFAVIEWAGTPRNASDEHSELRWFRRDDLMQLRISDSRIASLFSAFLGN